MFLDTTLKSLELVLGSAQTTTAMPITVDYVDLTSTTTTTGANDTQSNGTSTVTILAAPAASTTRKINGITIYNADSISKIVTVRLNNNSTLRILVSATLNVGDTLGYTDTDGWYTQDTNGNRKIASSMAAINESTIRLNTANGYGSTNTVIRRFANIASNVGIDITYADSATNGATFTINTNGWYAISFTDCFTTPSFVGLSLNSANLTTNIVLCPVGEILSTSYMASNNGTSNACWVGHLVSGSIIRAHNNGVAVGTNVNSVQFTITRIA